MNIERCADYGVKLITHSRRYNSQSRDWASKRQENFFRMLENLIFGREGQQLIIEEIPILFQDFNE